MYSSVCMPVFPAWVSPFGDPRVLMSVCGSPRLIAAYHVLHRLLLPRHPPCALSSLTIKFTHAHRPCGRITSANLMSLLMPLLYETLSHSSSARNLRHS